LSLLTCGPLPPNPPELIATDAFASLVQTLRKEFDWVLLDSPPLVGLVDAVHISSRSDMVLLVIRHASTDREMLRRALDAVRRANGTVVGAVLNDVDITRSDARSSYGAVYYPLPPSDGKEKASTLRRPAAL
jgi:Mrp family chromosome partitioning ATPase